MNITLKQRFVRTERHVGTATQQVVVEDSFDLGPELPDIARIVRLRPTPTVTDWEVSDDEVVVHGTVDLRLLYTHDEEVAPPAREIEAERGYEEDEDVVAPDLHGGEFREMLYSAVWRRVGNFEAVLDVDGAHEDAIVDVDTFVEDVDVRLHQNGRAVDVEAVFSVTVRVGEYDDVQVTVRDDVSSSQVEAEELAVDVEHVKGRGEAHLSVEGSLPSSHEIPLRTIVDVAARARGDGQVETDGQVKVQGTLQYRVVGADEAGEFITLTWDEQTPFTYTFDIDGAEAGESVAVRARVTGLDAIIGAGGRALEVNADVDVTARLADVHTVRMLDDVAGGSDDVEVRTRKATFSLERWVGASEEAVAVSQTLDLPPGYPPVDRLLSTEGRVRIDDALVLGDKVIIEGQVDVDMLYVAHSEGNPVHSVPWLRAVPLELEVAIPGAEPGMEADVRARVAEVELDLINRETVEAKARIVTDVAVSRAEEYEAVVEAVAVPPADENPPTMTFVVIQAGDTLWKLSNRYHTDIGTIVGANEWLDSADAPLPPGRKLCVPRHKPTVLPTTTGG